MEILSIPLALIGYGTHSQHHAENLDGVFPIVSVWDPDDKVMQQVPSEQRAGSLAELLAAKAEAVIIGSPEQFHLEQIEECLAAGMHVFCEKPLLVPDQPFERLEEAFRFAEQNALVISTCHPRRFDRPTRWFKACDWGHFGKPVSFSFDFSYHAPESAWKHGRSLLLDHLNHEVDLMNALFGIQGFSAWDLADGHDRYAVCGVRDDDLVFHFQGTRRLDSKTYPEWFRVRFERGEVSVDMMMGTATIIDHETRSIEITSGVSIDYGGRLRSVMTDFARQITTGTPGYLSRSEMLMNSEVGIRLQSGNIERISVRP